MTKYKEQKEIFKIFDIKNGEELTNCYLKSDVILLADIFEKTIKTSTEEYGINPLYCVILFYCVIHYIVVYLATLGNME